MLVLSLGLGSWVLGLLVPGLWLLVSGSARAKRLEARVESGLTTDCTG